MVCDDALTPHHEKDNATTEPTKQQKTPRTSYYFLINQSQSHSSIKTT